MGSIKDYVFEKVSVASGPRLEGWNSWMGISYMDQRRQANAGKIHARLVCVFLYLPEKDAYPCDLGAGKGDGLLAVVLLPLLAH